jgi:hypothetical protein
MSRPDHHVVSSAPGQFKASSEQKEQDPGCAIRRPLLSREIRELTRTIRPAKAMGTIMFLRPRLGSLIILKYLEDSEPIRHRFALDKSR